jgi:hypothetical protein
LRPGASAKRRRERRARLTVWILRRGRGRPKGFVMKWTAGVMKRSHRRDEPPRRYTLFTTNKPGREKTGDEKDVNRQKESSIISRQLSVEDKKTDD